MKEAFVIVVFRKDEFETIITNPKGDTFTFNPQEHAELADFLHVD